MKIDIISDLHLTKAYSINIEPESDLIIIAGDVSSDADITIEFLNSLSKKYKSVIYTFGNIELWYSNNPYNKLNYIKNRTNDNVFILDFSRCVKVNNIVITGGIYISPENLTNQDKENITDYSKFVEKLSLLSKSSIYKHIKELNPRIIVTHYPPISVSQLKRIYDIKEIKFKKLWIFGHYHQFKSFAGIHPVAKNILYVSNASDTIMTLEI
ncbi:metallophosphoesterase family protein [Desulfurobacterium sp.]